MKNIKLYEEWQHPSIKGNERKVVDNVYNMLKKLLDSGDVDYYANRSHNWNDEDDTYHTIVEMDDEYYHLKVKERNNNWNVNYDTKIEITKNYEPNEDEEEWDDDLLVGDVFRYTIEHTSTKLRKVIKELVRNKKRIKKIESKKKISDDIDDFFLKN